MALSSIFSIVHVFGIALATGAATVKLLLLLRCRSDHSFIPVYLNVARPITKQIIAGMILLTLSGIGWLVLGYPFSARLIVKIILVATIWVTGPIIDNVVEPRFQKLATTTGGLTSPSFARVQKQYVILELAATLLFYLIIVVWVLR